MNKKAATEIIAYVLLVGMAIALATIVSIWIKSTAEENVKDIVEPIEDEMLCSDVSFNVNLSDGCTIVKVSNKGYFTIEDFIVRINNALVYNGLKSQTNIIDSPLKPGETKTLNNLPVIINNNEIEIIPIVRGSSCSIRKVSTKCQL